MNFGRLNTGLDVTPAAPTQLVGLTITSANDAPGRDPATFLLIGLTRAGTPKLVATGEVPAFASRGQKQTFYLSDASDSFSAYRVVFPTVHSAAPDPLNNSMQLAELELLGAPADRTLRIVDFRLGELPAQGAERPVQMTIVLDPGTSYDVERSADGAIWTRWVIFSSPHFFTTLSFADPLVPLQLHRIKETGGN